MFVFIQDFETKFCKLSRMIFTHNRQKMGFKRRGAFCAPPFASLVTDRRWRQAVNMLPDKIARSPRSRRKAKCARLQPDRRFVRPVHGTQMQWNDTGADVLQPRFCALCFFMCERRGLCLVFHSFRIGAFLDGSCARHTRGDGNSRYNIASSAVLPTRGLLVRRLACGAV